MGSPSAASSDRAAAGAAPRVGPYDLLAPLGRGSAAVVHRARHRQRGDLVALKRLRVDDPEDVAALQREVAILGRLRHPGVVRVLEHGIDDGIPWYAMELVDGRSLEALWAERPPAGPPSPDQRHAALRTLQRVCEVLSVVHGEGFVHRDLKPANIILRADGEPVLVDFGLAGSFAARSGREVLELGGDLVGSIAYMAPEQLRGEFVDARADLYALGCILYEAVVGALPFAGSPSAVAAAHLRDPPPSPATRAAGLADDLEALILALLAKDPRRRPGYASDVARRLAAAVGTAAAGGGAPYLYRATFTGRDRAFAELAARLDRAVGGQSGCALLVGESGVGKTRLAMECTRAAATRGALVIAGECTPDADDSFAALRPVLRHLASACRQMPVEACRRVVGAHAAVLGTVEPALRRLPGLGALPPPPPLPAAAARERLVRAATEALAAWSVDVPLLVVLDDLQWADELTMSLFTGWATSATVGDATLLLLGTVRREEEPAALRPLADSPRLLRLVLERMPRAAVGDIVGDMLAVHPPPATLVGALYAHTEGNPFFVAEYLHAAVGSGLLTRDDEGRWRAAGQRPEELAALALPTTLQALIGRRLEQLAPAARAAVEAAAVLGREFDPTLMAGVAGLGEPEQAAALAALRGAHVADAIAAGRWRFAHDKLREVAHARLDPARRAALHGRAAAGLEARLGDDPNPPFAALAHHWAVAGDWARAVDYLGRAGEHSLATGGLERARQQLREALARDPAAAAEPLRRAHWLRLLAQATLGDDLEATVTHADEGLRLLGTPSPRHAAGWGARLVVDLLRVAAPARAARSAAARWRAAEAAHITRTAASSHYYRFDMLRGIGNSLRCIAFARRAGEPGRAALPYAQLGYMTGGARLHGLARRCFARAHALRDTPAADPSDFAAGLYYQAMYEMGLGQWSTARRHGEESMTRLRELGNLEEAEVAAAVLSNTLCYSSDLQTSARVSDALRTSAERRGHNQHRGWGLFLLGRAELALGDVGGGLAHIAEGHGLLARTQDFVSIVMCEGLLARALWLAGDRAAALRVADELDRRLATRRLVPLAQCLDGYGGLADVRLRHYAAAPAPATRAAARHAQRALRRFSRLFPIGAPAALRAAARLLWVDGDQGAARRAWTHSRSAARRLAMPFDEAGAALDLAAAGEPAAAAEATATLRALGCAAALPELETFPC